MEDLLQKGASMVAAWGIKFSPGSVGQQSVREFDSTHQRDVRTVSLLARPRGNAPVTKVLPVVPFAKHGRLRFFYSSGLMDLPFESSAC
jgi:hypothetical protein